MVRGACGGDAMKGRISRAGCSLLVVLAAFTAILLGCESLSEVSGPARWLASSPAFSITNAASVFTRSVFLKTPCRTAELQLASAGWVQLRVNGRPVDDRVLTPTPTQPDRRLLEVRYDLSEALSWGGNVIEVLTGNGWWNMSAPVVWGLEKAAWFNDSPAHSGPMIRATLIVDGQVRLVTDATWEVFDSPVVFNQLRFGEHYDARREDVKAVRRPALVVPPPPALVTADSATPCRVLERRECVAEWTLYDGSKLYDFGANVAGWCEIEVTGERGAKVILDHDEQLDENYRFFGHVAVFNRSEWPWQHDEYVLAGRSGGERWHPRFNYHGFRYVRVRHEGKVQLTAIRQCRVGSDLAVAGAVETSDADFRRVFAAARNSYLANFVGFPTDCPHREKNGWTADAQLMAEAGLWNFDARESYRHYLQMVLDAVRPNGELPATVPCAGDFAYGWRSGPAWNAVIFELPRQIYRFYGDETAVREAYPAWRKYLEFAETWRDDDGLYQNGYGDWSHPVKAVDKRFTESAYIADFCLETARWARRWGDIDTATNLTARAQAVQAAIRRKFYRGDGHWADDSLTALSGALYFAGLCPAEERPATLARLVEKARSENHAPVFGILGAKWCPRVLAENGYADDAFRFFVQRGEMGWMRMVESGDTLWEDFVGKHSRNHAMFGDLMAWAYEYAAGIVPMAPGFTKVAFRPHYLTGVESFSGWHDTPQGRITAGWRRVDGEVKFDYSVPPGVEVVP